MATDESELDNVIDLRDAQRTAAHPPKPRRRRRRPTRGCGRREDATSLYMPDAYFYEAVGVRLRLEREMRGWTQIDVERKARIKHEAICRYETGRSRIPVHILAQLASVYDLTVDQLIPW